MPGSSSPGRRRYARRRVNPHADALAGAYNGQTQRFTCTRSRSILSMQFLSSRPSADPPPGRRRESAVKVDSRRKPETIPLLKLRGATGRVVKKSQPRLHSYASGERLGKKRISPSPTPCRKMRSRMIFRMGLYSKGSFRGMCSFTRFVIDRDDHRIDLVLVPF